MDKPTKKQLALREVYFGSWEVVKEDLRRSGYVVCRCKCGISKSIRADSLIKGDSKSCGCDKGISCGYKFKSESKSDHILYQVWTDMNRRCFTVTRKDYKHYGARGIKVCNSWSRENKDGFINFLEDMENSFERGLELERLNNDGDYEKSNCKWVSRRSQVNNTRVNSAVEYEGLSLTLSEWSHLLKINHKDLQDRLGKLNNSFEEVITNGFNRKAYEFIYKGEIVSLKDIREREGINYYTQRQSRLREGSTLKGLISLGIEVEEVKPRHKGLLNLDKSLKDLKTKERDSFEDNLLFKIEKQIGDINE